MPATPEEPGAVQVQYAIDDLARGAAIADAVLRDRLAACVQRIGPIRSRYWWHGAIEEAEEWLFACKTTPARSDALVARIAELHPYEVPEVLVVPVERGLGRYLAWLSDAVAAGPGER